MIPGGQFFIIRETYPGFSFHISCGAVLSTIQATLQWRIPNGRCFAVGDHTDTKKPQSANPAAQETLPDDYLTGCAPNPL